ncbi:hypothetical protein EVA_20847 [gut metagenome]|uniref:Uncharacterized protein n=1 Tax=gut metagenome TaxID=749906 RepID=J9F842_9ZZZZ
MERSTLNRVWKNMVSMIIMSRMLLATSTPVGWVRSVLYAARR